MVLLKMDVNEDS